MGMLFRLLGAAMLLLTASCSVKSSIEALSSPEDRAFARQFIADVRSGNGVGLQRAMDPQLWKESITQLPAARTFFPATEGETELVGFNKSVSTSPAGREEVKNYVLVTSDGKHWTTTQLRTMMHGKRQRIVAWNIKGDSKPPAALQEYQTMEAAVPWVRAGLAAFVLIVGGLIFFLTRRSRRKRAGQPPF
ncbi:hypothetical protein ACFB49_00910 [Sphingomonas sp. DBB INV C78]|uniref:hypothetical protein n=1 Tax=Sphingomonas sp. DBB INV C78 TaxID=3349434 RepID=UPI0036D371CB